MQRLIYSLMLALMTAFPCITAEESAPPDDLAKQRAGLLLIQEFADNFCKTVADEGDAQDVEIQGKTQAEAALLFKKLANIGIEDATKYQKEEGQGPLRENLERMTKSNQDCRLEIWRDLKGKILGSSNRPAPSSRQSTTSIGKLLKASVDASHTTTWKARYHWLS